MWQQARASINKSILNNKTQQLKRQNTKDKTRID